MSELKPCDFLGDEIRMGDEVAFFALGYRMFTRGIVVRITPKCLFIDYDNSWNYDHHEEHTRQEQKQVIDLTALNRRAQPANEPLTLEQLREAKDGAPLWMAYEDGAYGEWGLVCYNRDGFTVVGLREHHKPDDYGKTWLAYRRPPERSENDG